MKPRYFNTQSELRIWFVENHDHLPKFGLVFIEKTLAQSRFHMRRQ